MDRVRVSAFGAALLVSSVSAWGGGGPPTVTEQGKFTAPTPDIGDLFGSALIVEGQMAVVGVPDDEDHGLRRGAAYVFTRVGLEWVLSQELVPSDGHDYQYFGFSVDMQGDTLVVGTLHTGAYVYGWDGAQWVEDARLSPPPGGSVNEEFGSALALDGDVVVIGARKYNTPVLDAGAAYVFERDSGGWSPPQQLIPPSPDSFDYFGTAVDVSGGRIIVGAEGDDDVQSAGGAIHVFEQQTGTWVPTGQIFGQGIQDFLGSNVALDGDVLAATVSEGFGTGVVRIYETDGDHWTQQAELAASDGHSNDGFGWPIALAGERLVCGASRDAQLQGSAYFFERDGGVWVERQKLLASDGTTGSEFGVGIAMSGDTVLVGAVRDDQAALNAGAVYWFELAGVVHPCQSTNNSTGEMARLGLEGTRSVADNAARLLVSSCPPMQPGLFIYGEHATQLPFGDGILCISPFAPGIHRLNPRELTDASGSASRMIDFPSLPGGGVITGGSTWHFQFWFRDPAAGGAGFNLSEGMQVTFLP